MNTFSFVGKIVPIKDTEKFKGYTEMTFDSGWMNQKLRFNVVAGDNRHLVEINAGKWTKDEKNSVIKTMSKAKDGEKGKPIEIEWSKRNDAAEIDKVAGYRVFTIDTDTYSHRRELEENGEDEALETSKKKRRHFLAGTDFCEFARKVVNSEKIKNMMFRVNGNIVTTYNAKNDIYYVAYEATKITRVDDNAESSSDVNIDFFFTEGAINSDDYHETGKAMVNGYSTFYDSNTKKNWFYPISLIIRGNVDERDTKKLAGYERILSKFEDDEVRKISFACTRINGAQKTDIKFEDLDEETQENIESGLISLEDAIRDAGGQMYGDRIQEIRIDKLGWGSSKGSETTVFTVDDLNKKPSKDDATNDIDTDVDVFAEDDDI